MPRALYRKLVVLTLKTLDLQPEADQAGIWPIIRVLDTEYWQFNAQEHEVDKQQQDGLN